jgi:two-component system sensor histidine kinase YesM
MRWGLNRLIIRYLQDISLKRKLLLSYSILILIPLATISIYSYNKITQLTHERTFYSATQSFNQTYDYLSYKLYKMIKSADLISTDKKVKEILNKPALNYPLTDQIQDMYDLVRYLTSFRDSQDIYKARLYVRDGFVYSNENTNIFNLNDTASSPWYKKLVGSREKMIGFPFSYFNQNEQNDTEIVSITQKIFNDSNYQEIVSLLRLDIKKKNIDHILSSANAIKESYTYLQNGEGALVASSDDSAVLDNKLILSPDVLSDSNDNGLQKAFIENRQVFYKTKLIPGMDWRMVTVIPESSIVNDIGKMKVQFFVQILVLGIIAYVAGYYISVSVTRRISRLVLRMKQVQEGSLDSIVKNPGKDEIGELIDNYNFMLRRITSLVQEQYQMGHELKNAELKALQSQINPHFLYNTLDLINWLSQKNQVSEIHAVTLALANFYKFSLNQGRDISTIDYEVRHVVSYVKIQNIRFRNKILLRLEVDEDIMNYHIPKITLQPIVENAILHGILEKPEKEGIITIQGWTEQDLVVLCVRDDGVGIDAKRLELIERGNPVNGEGNHYAIRNIQERLRLLYGEQCRLEFASKPGEGTSVCIKIPARSDPSSPILHQQD